MKAHALIHSGKEIYEEWHFSCIKTISGEVETNLQNARKAVITSQIQPKCSIQLKPLNNLAWNYEKDQKLPKDFYYNIVCK